MRQVKTKKAALRERAEYLDKCLGRLRQWHQGFKAAGGSEALDVDALRQAQVLLKELTQ